MGYARYGIRRIRHRSAPVGPFGPGTLSKWRGHPTFKAPKGDLGSHVRIRCGLRRLQPGSATRGKCTGSDHHDSVLYARAQTQH